MKYAGLIAIVVATLFFHSESVAAEGRADGAPPELAHWQKLIGDWSTTEEVLSSDGSEWQPSKGADWSFAWSFDGWGIQDSYVSPPRAVPVDDESQRQRGTNLRIYNPETKQWVMTWLTAASTQPATFTATSTEKQIVMHTDIANPQGFFGRITFFEMRDNSFEWKLEWSTDKELWQEVYRIHGTREVH